jgi:hypothetical protein
LFIETFLPLFPLCNYLLFEQVYKGIRSVYKIKHNGLISTMFLRTEFHQNPYMHVDCVRAWGHGETNRSSDNEIIRNGSELYIHGYVG